MSDGDSILGAVADAGKDLVTETVKQVVGQASSTPKAVTQQFTGPKSEEEAAKEKVQKTQEFQRIQEINAEISRISQENQKKTGPQIQEATDTNIDQLNTSEQTQNLDEASRQAIGRAEQGRNFKG